MSVLNIRKAQREGARLVVGVSGISGSGKTHTALLVAYGMVGGDGSKVGFIDTENRRGSLYADEKLYLQVQEQLGMPAIADPFLIGDLDAPFSPARYIEAIKQFQAAGVEVLVIDSISHEWEGIGGCEEIAEKQAIRGNKNWAAAKEQHKKFMNVLLASNMHIIVCIRAREKVKHQKDANGKTEVVPLGIMPVCEKNFMFELTASLMMYDGGKSRDVVKASGVEHIFGNVGEVQGYLAASHGRDLRAWVDGAKQLNPQVEAARNHLRSIANEGMDAYKKAWASVPRAIKQALVDDGSHESLKRSAEDFDKQRDENRAGGEALANLNKELEGVE